jgi:hypothetical protein
MRITSVRSCEFAFSNRFIAIQLRSRQAFSGTQKTCRLPMNERKSSSNHLKKVHGFCHRSLLFEAIAASSCFDRKADDAATRTYVPSTMASTVSIFSVTLSVTIVTNPCVLGLPSRPGNNRAERTKCVDIRGKRHRLPNSFIIHKPHQNLDIWKIEAESSFQLLNLNSFPGP